MVTPSWNIDLNKTYDHIKHQFISDSSEVKAVSGKPKITIESNKDGVYYTNEFEMDRVAKRRFLLDVKENYPDYRFEFDGKRVKISPPSSQTENVIEGTDKFFRSANSEEEKTK